MKEGLAVIRMELFIESSIEIEAAGFVNSDGCPVLWPAELPEVSMERINRDTSDNPHGYGFCDTDKDLARRFSRFTGIPVSRLLEQ